MAEVVNLRRFRKARSRADAEAIAVQNRSTFGQKREERDRLAVEARRAARRLEGHRLTAVRSTTPETGAADD